MLRRRGTCESVWPKVRAQVLVLQTCFDLPRIASPFGQGFRQTKSDGFAGKFEMIGPTETRRTFHLSRNYCY